MGRLGNMQKRKKKAGATPVRTRRAKKVSRGRHALPAANREMIAFLTNVRPPKESEAVWREFDRILREERLTLRKQPQ